MSYLNTSKNNFSVDEKNLSNKVIEKNFEKNLFEKNYEKNTNEVNDDYENDTVIEKIVIPKKNYYCSNCNRKGHYFKNCLEPIISNGIIGIYLEEFDKNLIPILEGYLIDNLKIFHTKGNNSPKNKSGTWLENNSKIKTFELNSKIKFLMIQRKKSLGYLEFIRGRYQIDNDDAIIHLLEQMTPEELNDIIKKDFDYLWQNLWDENNIRNKNHHKEYVVSKNKFYQLKMNKMKLLTETKPLFVFNEWGFPKGRRESYESDIVCAIREFEEETDYNEKQYTLLEDCKHIRENLVGTNGVNYAHNYFLTVLHEKNEYFDKSNREIGDIKVMDINECLDVIRPYHKNKIKIIKNIYLTINSFMKEYDGVNINS
jgi:hypothetical protein